MESDPKDIAVLHLLKKIKESNGTYPPEMLAMRRQGYLNQVAHITGGAGLAVGFKEMGKAGKGATGLSPVAGTVVEALLIIALVAEAGAVTYFYRDRLAQYFQSFSKSPKVEEVAGHPVLSSPIAEAQSTPTPVATATGIRTLTPGTPTPVSTPSVVFVAGTGQPGTTLNTTNTNNGGGVGVQPASTASPGTSGTGNNNNGGSSPSTPDPRGNNGNHYGQTPLPERTKENGNNPSHDPPSSSLDDNTNNKNKP